MIHTKNPALDTMGSIFTLEERLRALLKSILSLRSCSLSFKVDLSSKVHNALLTLDSHSDGGTGEKSCKISARVEGSGNSAKVYAPMSIPSFITSFAISFT